MEGTGSGQESVAQFKINLSVLQMDVLEKYTWLRGEFISSYAFRVAQRLKAGYTVLCKRQPLDLFFEMMALYIYFSLFTLE